MRTAVQLPFSLLKTVSGFGEAKNPELAAWSRCTYTRARDRHDVVCSGPFKYRPVLYKFNRSAFCVDTLPNILHVHVVVVLFSLCRTQFLTPRPKGALG